MSSFYGVLYLRLGLLGQDLDDVSGSRKQLSLFWAAAAEVSPNTVPPSSGSRCSTCRRPRA